MTKAKVENEEMGKDIICYSVDELRERLRDLIECVSRVEDYSVMYMADIYQSKNYDANIRILYWKYCNELDREVGLFLKINYWKAIGEAYSVYLKHREECVSQETLPTRDCFNTLHKSIVALRYSIEDCLSSWYQCKYHPASFEILKRKDDFYDKRKASLEDSLIKHFFALHGGGAVALLSYLATAKPTAALFQHSTSSLHFFVYGLVTTIIALIYIHGFLIYYSWRHGKDIPDIYKNNASKKFSDRYKPGKTHVLIRRVIDWSFIIAAFIFLILGLYYASYLTQGATTQSSIAQMQPRAEAADSSQISGVYSTRLLVVCSKQHTTEI